MFEGGLEKSEYIARRLCEYDMKTIPRRYGESPASNTKMKSVTFHKYYIQINSDTLMSLVKKLFRLPGKPVALAFFPFLVIQKSALGNPQTDFIINHEKIHFAQQLESLILFYWAVALIEQIYLRFIKGKKGVELYLSRAAEQECYDNMNDLEYLEKRKLFAWLREYWVKKRDISFDEEGYLIIDGVLRDYRSREEK